MRGKPLRRRTARSSASTRSSTRGGRGEWMEDGGSAARAADVAFLGLDAIERGGRTERFGGGLPPAKTPGAHGLPAPTVDPRLLKGTRSLVTLTDLFDLSARGELDTVFLSGVQIDAQGRINMSAIGPYERPKVRLPGGAGSACLMPTAKRTILWRTKHDPRTFVEKVSFVTAAGRVDRVVTPLCVFQMREGRLQVETIFPYSAPEQVRQQTGFPVEVDALTPIAPAPTAEEMAALQTVDPQGVRMVEF